MNEDHTTTLSPLTLEGLYTAYSARIYQRIYHLVRQREDAEDLTQEVFVRALRALPQLHTSRNLYGWLYRMATNVALDALRHQKLIPWQPLDDMAWTLEAADACDPQVHYSRTAGQVYAALDAMPVHYRHLLLLRAAGYSNPEVAQSQGRTPHALISFLARARASFTEHYQAREREEASA